MFVYRLKLAWRPFQRTGATARERGGRKAWPSS
jgi:hypothetical protein